MDFDAALTGDPDYTATSVNSMIHPTSKVLPHFSKAMHRVFVYGTLMRGGMNNGLLRSGVGVANFFGEAVTTENWPLVVGTSAFVPFVLGVRGRGMVSDRKAAAA